MLDRLFDAHCHLQVRPVASRHQLYVSAATMRSCPHQINSEITHTEHVRRFCIVQHVSSLHLLQDPRISGSVDEVIAEACTAGVRRFSVNGTYEDDWCRVRLPLLDCDQI
jgi:Tat protein secretion system quality control protein TatD with DNase activity